MEEGKEMDKDRERAEVFDSLGHPTRIAILKALNDGAVGFAELKKKVAIESSGHLQHHLNKLDGLIRTDEYGKYCLSDQGKDALLTVQTVESASSNREMPQRDRRHKLFSGKTGLKLAAILLTAFLIASSALALVEYNQTTVLQKQVERISGVNFDAMAYYNEFGIIPATNVNSSFEPPVSMYRALQIALEADGWNKTSLNGLMVGAYLQSWQTNADSGYFNGTNINSGNTPLTTPPSDYSDVYSNGIIYRFVWQVIVANSTHFTTPPIGFSLVDASSGQILPNPPLY